MFKQFFQRWSRQPYPVSDADSIKICIRGTGNKRHTVYAAVQMGGDSINEVNEVKATFTIRKAGKQFKFKYLLMKVFPINCDSFFSGLYNIEISVGNLPIKGSPFSKHFLPGPPDAAKTLLVRPISIVVCTTELPHQILLEPRDTFGNPCSFGGTNNGDQELAMEAFSLEAFAIGSLEPVQPIVQRLWIELMRRLIIHVTFYEDGIYLVRLKFHNQLIHKAEFNAIALSRAEAKQVEKAISTKTPTYETKVWRKISMSVNLLI